MSEITTESAHDAERPWKTRFTRKKQKTWTNLLLNLPQGQHIMVYDLDLETRFTQKNKNVG